MTKEDIQTQIDRLVNEAFGAASRGGDTSGTDREVGRLEEDLRREEDRERDDDRVKERFVEEMDRPDSPQREENTKTTAQLRREIERDYNEHDVAGQRGLKQIDALEDAGVHRVEAYDKQAPHISVDDAYGKLACEQDEAEKREAAAHRGDARSERSEQSDLDTGRDRRPEPSESPWAKEYEIDRAKDGSVIYFRDGAQQIRDHGRDVEVSNDPRAMRDAVRLCKEQGAERVEIKSQDPAKRQALMKEAYRQDLKIETRQDRGVEGEARKAMVAVERERAMAKHQAAQQAPQQAHAADISR